MGVVHLGEADGVAVLRLDRPPVNAVDLAAVQEINGALERIERNPPSSGFVLTGTGASFSSGVDFRSVPRYSAEERRAMVRGINRAVMRLYRFPRPVVAAVNGHAIGGGLILAMSCDVRIASGTGKFGLGEVSAGIPFPAAPLIVLKDAFERGAARMLALTGRLVDGAEARELGLIDEWAPPDALLAMAAERARALSKLPAYAAIKKQLRAEAVAEMSSMIERDSDPLLDEWLCSSPSPQAAR